MRVALLHNTSSGSEDHSDADLIAVIRRAGHQVEHVVARVSDLTAALQKTACDLVVVAGGDGTVGRAACVLSGWQVPLSILPLGTANNTARSLGLPARMRKLAKSWHAAVPVPFDLGVLSQGGLRQRFAEAVGWGLFPESIAQAKADPWRGNVRRTLKRDRRRFHEIAAQAKARPYRVEVDGRDVSGDYLLVEVMNVPLLGPRLELSSRSNSGDGQFEVVLATEAQRSLISELAESGALPRDGLTVEQGSKIRITAAEGVWHQDGRLLRHPVGLHSFEVEVQPGAISYLR